MNSRNEVIHNLITGRYVSGIDYDADQVTWTYNRANAWEFGPGSAEVLKREYNLAGGWVVPA